MALAAIALLFVLSVTAMPLLAPVFAWAFPAIVPPVYAGDSFATLFLYHAGLVAASSIVSIILGLGGAIFATRRAGAEFRPLLEALATIGQTFPPVAVLAIAVPALGYGDLPTFVALALYGILPILKNSMAGIASVSPTVLEAADAMGLRPMQRLWRVELPLAAPLILAGIRVSVIVNIGTATIGSTVGAVTLGTPIIGGLIGDKLAYVIQGAIVVGLFAIVADMGFERLDRRLRRFAARQ